MKYPPENYYSVPGLDNEWMTDQLQQEVNDIVGKEVDMDNIVMISDHITAREKNNLPTYQVFVKDDIGQYKELRDEDENLLRYKFDSSKAREKHRIKEVEETESLRRIRDRRIKAMSAPPRSIKEGVKF